MYCRPARVGSGGCRVTEGSTLLALAPGVPVRVMSAAHASVPAKCIGPLRDRLAIAFPTTLGASTLKQCDELLLRL